MKIEYPIVYTDGSRKTIQIRPRDMLAFERWAGEPVTDLKGVTAILKLVYCATLERGKTPDDGLFEAWVDSIEDIVTDEEESGPLSGTPADPDPSST